MRWKCSLLTDEEHQEHQEWINANLLEREEAMKRPWKARQEAEGSDELCAENEYIQRFVRLLPLATYRKLMCVFSCIDSLPTTIEVALDHIERSTGMKAIILIGGPTPASDGKIGTHW